MSNILLTYLRSAAENIKHLSIYDNYQPPRPTSLADVSQLTKENHAIAASSAPLQQFEPPAIVTALSIIGWASLVGCILLAMFYWGDPLGNMVSIVFIIAGIINFIFTLGFSTIVEYLAKIEWRLSAGKS